MKRIVPDSLGGWLFTVVVTAVVLIYGSTLVTYFIYRDQSAEVAAASQVADQLIVFKRLIEQAPLRERSSLIQALNSPGLRMVITTRPLVVGSDEVFTSRIIYRRLMAEFPEGTEIHTDSRIAESVGEERFPTQEEVRRELRRQRRAMQQPLRSLGAVLPPPPPPVALGFQPFVRASIRFGERTWLNARVDLDLTEAGERTRPFLQTAFLWTTLITFLIAILAILAVRRATMPVSLFAKAAERLGLGLNAEPLSERGTGEVRRAARAFNTMQSRLQRFVKDRTQMLAAISHDLRTPITRMRLRAEFVDDSAQREKMLSDLDDMEAMISVTLAFAREDAANEPAAPTDVAALVARIV
ncbi:MAG: histidine kinase dimerization/phospho-acceptor domain-containing protein, partial [Rhodospirillales bacterium]